MDHIVITISPPSDEALLTVSDAMHQVLDALTVFQAAERSLGDPHSAFVWRLEKATTNSPFRVTARAEPINPSVDVAPHVAKVKAEVAAGIDGLVDRGVPPRWLGPTEVAALRSVFTRHASGVGGTDIDLENGNVVSITPQRATRGLEALAAINAAIDVLADLQDREAFGEIEGALVAAGRYKNRPAIQVRTDIYGFVWCVLSETLIADWGSEQSIADVWKGQTVVIEGRLNYVSGGKLAKVEAIKIRAAADVPYVDLESILDPDFTSGLDPVEYLRQFNDGELN